jgi:hypothetical protein
MVLYVSISASLPAKSTKWVSQWAGSRPEGYDASPQRVPEELNDATKKDFHPPRSLKRSFDPIETPISAQERQ